ncbi:MAG: hypothetical protein EOO42_08005 [Flavobacteriales bacterium]|nr:MAG: hypothetical protein EOO42_08005 [Flavobacteriales bacterium]
MKRISFTKTTFFALVGIILLASCSSDEKPATAVENQPATVKQANPFPFYKNMEIKPGFNFEVVSWGKGVDSVGGYLILMSDSLKNNYKSIAVERKGIIADAWNMDLDNDGNPEIYIQYVVRNDVNDMNVYEFAGNSFDKISFPGLGTTKGYEGNDQFFVKNGELFRKVPIVSVDSGKTTTLVKTLQYRLRGNSFSPAEVKE